MDAKIEVFTIKVIYLSINSMCSIYIYQRLSVLRISMKLNAVDKPNSTKVRKNKNESKKFILIFILLSF